MKISKISWLLPIVFGACSGLGQMTPPARNPNGTIDKTKGIGVDQKLGAQVPLDLNFTESNGQTVNLRQFFGKSPVILNLVYFRCKSVCTLETENLAKTVQEMNGIRTAPHIGKDFQVLTVSINPQETSQDATMKKGLILTGLNAGSDSSWHFLTGSQDSIQKLVSAVGFHFTYEPQMDLINHPASLELISPQGKVIQYFFGDTYPADQLTAALSKAKVNKVGQQADYRFFGCLCQDPITGKYSLNIFRVVQVFGTLTVLLIGGFVGLWTVRSRSRAKTFRSNKNRTQ